ncbi:MAG: hypothetical protein K5877_07270 [Lachnospiraceae bacterium]|nr:hypothetical protein [Lachnospiraceae bacterium]
MDVSRNKFSNAMCALFTGVLLVLFCVCVGRKFGISNIVSRMIITAVYCGVVVGLAFVLNKTVKKFIDNNRHIDPDKTYLIGMIVASVLFIVIRLLVISDAINVDFVKSSISETAKIGSDGKIFFDISTADGLFATILSLMFKVFGNTFFPVYLIQTILSVGAYAMIVWSVKTIFGRFPSVTVAFGMAILPNFFRNIAGDGSDCLILFMFGFFMLVSALYKLSNEKSDIKTVFSICIGMISGIFALYSTIFVFVFLIPIAVLMNCNSEQFSTRLINVFCIIFGHLFGFGVPLVIYSYIFGGDGILGFVDELMKHLTYRFSYSPKPGFITALGDERGIFVLFILSVFYCVMYWKNSDDTAQFIIPYWVLTVSQMFFIYLNNKPAYLMIFAICLLIVGGCGLYDLGSTEGPVRIYRLEDDMQPVVIESINDKPVSQAAAKISLTQPAEEKKEEVKPEVTIKEEVKPEEEKAEEVKTEETKPEEEKSEEAKADVARSEETKTEEASLEEIRSEEVKPEQTDKSDEKPSEVPENVAEEKPEAKESKYSQPEVRKTSDFGMNDAVFEALFSANVAPVNAVSSEIYDMTPDVEEDEGAEETADDTETGEEIEAVVEDQDAANEGEDMWKNDSKDQKAYVDSFFGYLYNEPASQDETVEETKKDKYVSHASNFADLDLDLGIDAFDNLNPDASEDDLETADARTADVKNDIPQPEVKTEVKEEDTVKDEFVFEESDSIEPVADTKDTILPEASFEVEEIKTSANDSSNDWEDFKFEDNHSEPKREIENIESEFVFDFNKKHSNDRKGWDFIAEEEHGEEEELEVFNLLNEVDGIKLDNKDELKDAPAPVVTDEPGETLIFESKEETASDIDTERSKEPEEEVSIEEMLNKKIDEDFSYEDALTEKIENEEVEKEIGFSYEEALQKKLEVEEIIEAEKSKDAFSMEDAIREKIVTEESIENAEKTLDVSMVKTVEQKIGVEEDINDNLTDHTFSFQEAIEQKLDVERSIEKAQNEQVLAEFENEHLITEEDLKAFKETKTEDFVFEEKPETETALTEEVMDFETPADEFEFKDSNTVETVAEPVTTEATETEPAETESAKTEPEKPVETETVSDKTSENETEKVQPVEFIENPLPLPKKHVHREMDYGRSIPEAWMHYDVELTKENDHYDI